MMMPQIGRKLAEGISLDRLPFLLVKTLERVPDSCPFARTLKVGSHTVVIPPLCKLNPLYEAIITLKIRIELNEEN